MLKVEKLLLHILAILKKSRFSPIRSDPEAVLESQRFLHRAGTSEPETT
jgi:hypothetical protein